MEIKQNCAVEMHYTLKNDAGEVIDSSDGQAPLPFLFGAGNIIVGLEKALAGKKQGDAVEVTVEPAEGYGEHHAELIQEVPMASFEGVDEINVGMQFHADTGQDPILVTVTKVEGDTVTVDGNHALAGERLHFSVTIEAVREATAEEITHGHVHTAGGCAH